MAREIDPSLNRRRLRIELRKAREAKGQTQTEAAQALDWSLSKIMRIEAGTVSISVTDLRALVQLYGLTDEQLKTELEEAARGSRGLSWWTKFNDVLDPAFRQYLGYESAAASIRTYHPIVVPGLLQTEDYAMAMLAPRVDEARARRIVELRTERQERALEGDTPPWTFFVLDEAALHRQVGGPRVQRGQLQHLIDMVGRPRVSVYVLPFTASAHYATLSSFILLGFTDDEDLLYLEAQGNQSIRDDHELIVRYQECFESLREIAFSGDQAVDLISKTRDGLDTS
ncbi:helix-turn-helix domain-containing protein [Streptomyces longispororuber]|uniref:helix-turn-helix domain-containing protein n=1 Tax=Streptomyces longispororuber TaxID=68230 RepID=UPI00210D0547|nr:helix-turn-helix transcriptional regulator [Streptomyces longispororuber]MCQ4213711.1 helix-turn-helix domain-containing protein [Streptomyces longispororuber]